MRGRIVGRRYLVLGTGYTVRDTRGQMPGQAHPADCTTYQVPGSRVRSSGATTGEPGTEYRDLGTSCRQSGKTYLVPDTVSPAPFAKSRKAALALFIIALSSCNTPPTTHEWTEADGFRWARVDPVGKGSGFEPMLQGRTGIDYQNMVTDEMIVANRHVVHGSGVAAGDFDADGWVDLYFPRMDGAKCAVPEPWRSQVRAGDQSARYPAA